MKYLIGLSIGFGLGVGVEFYHLAPHQFLARIGINETYNCDTDMECTKECIARGFTAQECEI